MKTMAMFEELKALENRYKHERHLINEKYRYINGHYGIMTRILKAASRTRALYLWSITADEDRKGLIARNYNNSKSTVSVYIQPSLSYERESHDERYDVLLYVPLVGTYYYLTDGLERRPDAAAVEERVRLLLPEVREILFSRQRIDS